MSMTLIHRLDLYLDDAVLGSGPPLCIFHASGHDPLQADPLGDDALFGKNGSAKMRLLLRQLAVVALDSCNAAPCGARLGKNLVSKP